MSILLETSLGDLTIDLDVTNSPKLCHNILKLAKARYYTNTLIYNVQQGRFCQMGDPRGDGNGGCSIHGLIDTLSKMKGNGKGNGKGNEKGNDLPRLHVERSQKRFIKSNGKILTKDELQEKGRVVATEMGGVKNTIGSQFLITIDEGPNRALDGIIHDHHTTNGNNNDIDDDILDKKYYSLGKVVEDEDDVLEKINGLYCDKGGRPYADVRIIRMHILDDPFHDDDHDDDGLLTNGGMTMILQKRNITLMKEEDLPKEHIACARWLSSSSPKYAKPREEIVEERISYEEAMVDQGDEEAQRKKQQEILKKEDKSNAAILEMLGDIGSADAKPPENVLFVCKLNPSTEDDDLQLIFSRFDQNAKAEIIRDPDTGDSLQYAFVEFDTKEACNEAYFKMNNALIDDRRIKVDFSQSVAKEWNRYTLSKRGGRGRGGFNPGGNRARGHYKNDRQLYQPKKEKKYYGGYRQSQGNGDSNEDQFHRKHDPHGRGTHHRENATHDHHESERRRNPSSYDQDRDGNSDSDEYSVEHRRERKKSSRRKDSHKRHTKERKRRSKDSNRDKSNERERRKGACEDDDIEDRDEDRHRKKHKHKHHKHKSRRRSGADDDDDERRRDRHREKKRHKRSSRRSRSRS